MKRTVAIILAMLVMASMVVSCSSRKAVDISGFDSIADLNNSKAVIGAQKGTFHYDALTAQVSGVEAKMFEDFNVMLTALKAGTIDGYVAEEPTAFAVMAENSNLDYIKLVNNTTGFTASDADTGIAVAFKTGNAMVSTVNGIIATISAETRTTLMSQIVEMSIDTDKALNGTLALASDKTDTSNGTLKIAMECAYKPFNWAQTTDVNGAVKINGSDLYANGYDVQVAKYIAAELGMALEIHMVEWDSLIAGLNAGTYDGIIAGMSPTAEREEQVDFTDCYYNSNLVIIYKKG
jgi:ABC-type amino acid transport substrate-binding protein